MTGYGSISARGAAGTERLVESGSSAFQLVEWVGCVLRLAANMLDWVYHPQSHVSYTKGDRHRGAVKIGACTCHAAGGLP